MTTYGDGLYQFGGVPVTPSVPALGGPPTGNVFYVQTTSGVNAGAGKSPVAPYQTLAYTLSQAASGDIIYLMPGSTITVSSATALLLNVAGVTIIGLGVGDQRPLFDFTTANTATIPVSVDGVTIQNCRFRASFLSIAAAFTLTTARYFTLIGNKFFDASNVLDFLNIVSSTGAANTANGLTAIGNTWNGLGTTSVNSFILTANDIDSATVQSNTVLLARTATAAILMTVTAGVLTNLLCTDNSCTSQQTAATGGELISLGGTTSTGLVARNYVADLATSDVMVTITTGVRFVNNYKTGVLGASGFLVPAADT